MIDTPFSSISGFIYSLPGNAVTISISPNSLAIPFAIAKIRELAASKPMLPIFMKISFFRIREASKIYTFLKIIFFCKKILG